MADSRYFRILDSVDAEFARNLALHGERMRCRAGCTDCCHHRFRITLIEADLIFEAVRAMPPDVRQDLMQRAREYLASPPGARRACPALQENLCTLYKFRPLICHKFGMPIYNPDRPGQIFACELNFRDGEEINDDQLISIQTAIHQEWKDLQSESAQKDIRTTVAGAILGHHSGAKRV